MNLELMWQKITAMHRIDSVSYTHLRIIIFLTRDVTPDEYGAVSRMLASDIGIELFDDSTYEPSRLMYWPSTSSDGEYMFCLLYTSRRAMGASSYVQIMTGLNIRLNISVQRSLCRELQ